MNTLTDSEIRLIIEGANTGHPYFDLVRKFEDQAREIVWETYKKQYKYWEHAEWLLFCKMIRFLIEEHHKFES